MSIVRSEQPGEQNEPSPSIWKDCPKGILRDCGLGYFSHNDFLGATVDTIAAGEQRPNYQDLSIDADDDTVVTFVSGRRGGILDLESDGDDNDAYALFSQPTAQITRFDEQKSWFEAASELGDVTADQGMFLGYAEEGGLSRDVMADDVADVGDFDLVGFQVLASDPDAIDAIYRLSGSATVVVSADISNSTALGTNAGALANDTQFKVGLRYDGKDEITFFFNGTLVARLTVDASLFPVNTLMGAIAGFKTGTAAAQSSAHDWIRHAHQLRQ